MECTNTEHCRERKRERELFAYNTQHIALKCLSVLLRQFAHDLRSRKAKKLPREVVGVKKAVCILSHNIVCVYTVYTILQYCGLIVPTHSYLSQSA